MTIQKDNLDSLRTLLWFVLYRHLAPKFQHSLSAVTLDIYLGGGILWVNMEEQETYCLCGSDGGGGGGAGGYMSLR